jgi:hypothetical protein
MVEAGPFEQRNFVSPGVSTDTRWASMGFAVSAMSDPPVTVKALG